MATFNERIGILYNEFRSLAVGNGRAAYARKLKVTKGQLGGWLDGAGTPDLDTLKRLSRDLQVSILWLIGQSNDRSLRADEIMADDEILEKELDFFLDLLTYRLGEKGIQKLQERLEKKGNIG